MKAVKSIQESPRLPADVAAINDIAKAHRIRVEVALAGNVATIYWRGYVKQLRATGLVRPSTPLMEGSTHRFSVPHDWHGLDLPWLNGTIKVTSAGRFEFQGESKLPEKIQRLIGGIEVCRYADFTSWYGPSDALIREGVCTARQLPLGKQAVKGKWYYDKSDEPTWKARRHPSGMMRFCRETEEAARVRREEEARYAQACSPERTSEDDLDVSSEQIDAILRRLPAFIPSSMSEGEKHFMRLVRGLDDDRRNLVMDFVQRYFERQAAEETKHNRKTPGLQLVVDNDKP
jgi:hypothetical protein